MKDSSPSGRILMPSTQYSVPSTSTQSHRQDQPQRQDLTPQYPAPASEARPDTFIPSPSLYSRILIPQSPAPASEAGPDTPVPSTQLHRQDPDAPVPSPSFKVRT